MTRSLLVLAALALPADAAPQLKPRKPAPGTEEARIEALKAKYAEIHKSGSSAEQVRLAAAEAKIRTIMQALADLDARPHSPRHQELWTAMEKNVIAIDPILTDLYDIAKFDRKKAAAGK